MGSHDTPHTLSPPSCPERLGWSSGTNSDHVKPATLIAVVWLTFLTAGSAWWLHARDTPPPRKHYPKPTPPPPASPIFVPSKEPAPSAEEIEYLAREHNALLEHDIDLALRSGDAQRREAVFTFLLPELLQVEPTRVVGLFDRQPPGEARDTLRKEISRQWINQDREAATAWMKSLRDPAERRGSVVLAVKSLAFHSPEVAQALADEFGIGREPRLLEAHETPR